MIVFLVIVLSLYLLFCCMISRGTNSVKSLLGKTAIVTGGKEGLGYATCLHLASRGCRVIIADFVDAEESKSKIIEATKNPNISTKLIDLSSFKSVRKFASDIRDSEDKIDILINNAGIAISNVPETEDGLNPIMQINFFGHFLLTHLLLDLIKKSEDPRIVFTGSFSVYFHSLTLDILTNKDKCWKEYYGNSKLCCVLAAQEFAKKLKRSGVKVFSIDPGYAKSEIFRKAYSTGMVDLQIKLPLRILHYVVGQKPLENARNTLNVILSDDLESGAFYRYLMKTLKPPVLGNSEFCVEIWKKSEEVVQLEPELRI